MPHRRFQLLLRILGVGLGLALGLGAAPPPWPPAEQPIAIPAGERFPLPPSVTASERNDGRWDVEFSLKLDTAPKSVTVAGSFNNWNREALPMARGADGIWRATAALEAGEWQYKFVLDGSVWREDPRNPEQVDDNHAGHNSLLRLGAVANIKPGSGVKGDGTIDAVALAHDPAAAMYRQELADGRWLVRYRTLAHDVEGVDLLAPGLEPAPMASVLSTPLFQYWEGTLPGRGPDGKQLDDRTPYTFRVRDGGVVVRHHTMYKLERGASPLRTPEWAKHAIWYQIMPERFRNGAKENDPPKTSPWTSDWYAMTEAEQANGRGFYPNVFDRLYGGDLQGVGQQLAYLKELGVNAIYFTPIFQSPSLHRYDATNYVHVEELLGVRGDYKTAEAKEDLLNPKTWTWTGSDKVFLAFLKVAKAQGFRVIVDGVFNHVGTAHPAFVDVRTKGKRSRFADWFQVRSWEPFEYEGWAGFGGMPVFRKDEEKGIASETARAHLMEITRRWMDPNGDGDPSDGVDGWRLDVPNEVPMPFWREWRRLVKSINPDAYIVGEIWRRADDWLDGRSFDAVMNYPFAETAIAWIGNKEKRLHPSEVDRRLAELRLAYPSEATYVLQNLLDSHDTDRVASMMMNPDREYNHDNRPQDGAKAYVDTVPDEAAYRKVRLLVLLQMTYVGAPMVWYGDEVGMWGASDPTNRKPMVWADLEPYAKPEANRVRSEQLACYQAAIALRNGTPALRTGSFRTLLADDAHDVWVFERELDGVRVVVALNASNHEATIAIPGLAEGHDGWREIFCSSAEPPYAKDGRPRGADFPTVRLPAIGGKVWEHRP